MKKKTALFIHLEGQQPNGRDSCKTWKCTFKS
uniref:Uncharacterized protein n=1 Tax=Ciona intestinalis TaxID=7719 RepID=H2Y1X4_CIOIN